MTYKVVLSEQAARQLKKLDRYQARLIVAWIEKNLQHCSEPRRFGKALTADKKGYWRYRMGDYRILAEIVDDRVVIVIIRIGHRRDV